MTDFHDPIVKFLLNFRVALEERNFTFAVRDVTASVYIWGKQGFFHVRWIETLERDYWEVFSANHTLETFDTEEEAKRSVLELMDMDTEEEMQNV